MLFLARPALGLRCLPRVVLPWAPPAVSPATLLVLVGALVVVGEMGDVVEGLAGAVGVVVVVPAAAVVPVDGVGDSTVVVAATLGFGPGVVLRVPCQRLARPGRQVAVVAVAAAGVGGGANAKEGRQGHPPACGTNAVLRFRCRLYLTRDR